MSRTAVVAFGRFQAPTSAHWLLAQKVKELAYLREAEPFIWTSHTVDNKRNPLSYETRMGLLKSGEGDLFIWDISGKVRNIFDVMKRMEEHDFTDVIVVGGSDRVDVYNKKLQLYNGKDYTLSDIEVVQFGKDRGDACDGNTLISGTYLRECARSGDFNEFKKFSFPGTPFWIERAFHEIRSKYGLTESN